MAEGSPSNITSLLARLRNHCQAAGHDETRAQRHLAAMVVAQLLRGCGTVVKGGRNLEIRYGLAATRASSDLDTVRAQSFSEFLAHLEDALDEGWAGFSGRVRDRGRIAAPVPDGYQPHRLDVVLTYKGKPGVGTITLEVAVEEAGGLEDTDLVESHEATALFTAVGLPTPDPVALLSVHVQIAQKLHACTTPDEDAWVNERAHDLVDLQLLCRDLPDRDLQRTRDACVRLFTSRQRHSWPPKVTARAGWEDRYAEERSLVAGVHDSVKGAVDWANLLVSEIESAGR